MSLTCEGLGVKSKEWLFGGRERGADRWQAAINTCSVLEEGKFLLTSRWKLSKSEQIVTASLRNKARVTTVSTH